MVAIQIAGIAPERISTSEGMYLAYPTLYVVVIPREVIEVNLYLLTICDVLIKMHLNDGKCSPYLKGA